MAEVIIFVLFGDFFQWFVRIEVAQVEEDGDVVLGVERDMHVYIAIP